MRVYSISGVAPEIQAYAMAKYSRSSQSMLETVGELTSSQAEHFLNTFYFQYGHRSIADLAHVAMAIEDISILAAISVADEPLWDGQERSTRYQDFRRSGYVVPSGMDEATETWFRGEADFLFSEYEQLTRLVHEQLMAAVQRPADLDESSFRRTLRARAFDVTRGLLPLATATSLGQVVSARVLERQISRLLGDAFPEIRAIGGALRDACRAPAETPTFDQVRARLDEAAGADLPEPYRRAAMDAVDILSPRPLAPTLVKYTQPDTYSRGVVDSARDSAEALLANRPADLAGRVTLAGDEPLEDEIVATLLFAADRAGHSYRQIQDAVQGLSQSDKQALLDRSLRQRGKHDELPRQFRSGYQVKFDLLIDLGAYRDLHRHRRCVQILQPLGPQFGAEPAEALFRTGLGSAAAGAIEEGLADRFQSAVDRALKASGDLERETQAAGAYLLPLAARCRALFKMDLAEAAYVAELRTAPAGHFSYRRAAWEMAKALRMRYPLFAPFVRATDPDASFDLLQR